MSWVPGGASTLATQRIRVFSIVTWVLGSIVLVFVASFAAYSAVGFGGIAPLGGNYGNYPWDAADPVEADHTAGTDTWSAGTSGVIRIPRSELDSGPLQARLSVGDRVELYLPNPEDVGRANPPYPNYVRSLYDDEIGVIVPSSTTDLELWITADRAWELIITPIDALEIEDELAGSGDAFIVYRGDAVSANFIHRGDGIFFVDVYTPLESDTPIIESGEVQQRVSWDPSDLVVFQIESTGDGGWVVDMDLLAESSSSARARIGSP